MSGNMLSSLPLAVAPLSSLRHLDLSRNRISAVNEEILSNLTSLTYLSLSDNLLYQAEELSLDNLRPSLTTLILSNNGFSRFPKTFQQRFDVLRKLDLSNNRLVIIPTSFQANTPQLEDLLLDNNQIENIILEPIGANLRRLSLLGNRLRCDCKSLWLRRLLDTKEVEVFVPTCFSPFSRNTLHLSSFEGTSLCSLSDQARIPKFFRVTDKDTAHFPRDSFTSLQLENVNVVSKSVMNITFKIDLEFYYNEFDWGIIYREIGADGGRANNMFYKTKFNLRDYAADHADWSPRKESATFLLKVPETDKYYELCLAVIETSTTYYLHQDLCSEVDMRTRVSGQAGTNLTIVPDISSVAVGWMANGKASSLVRQISVREFGHSYADKVLVSDIFNSSQPSARFYTIENLKPGAGYVVCFMTIYGDVKQSQADLDSDDGDCREIVTLASVFPVKEVATAAAVSTSTTAVVVALVCCCCFPCRKKSKKKSKGLDVNENEACKVKQDKDDSPNDESNDSRADHIFHQRYVEDSSQTERSCGEKIWLSCVDQKESEMSCESSNSVSQSYSYDDQICENSVYSQIKTNDHICDHGPVISQTEDNHNYSLIDKPPAKREDTKEVVVRERKPLNPNLTVRSAHSLSSKYSDRKFEETKKYLKKNASLCIRPDPNASQPCHEPPTPPRILPDGSRIMPPESMEAEIQLNPNSGRVVLRKRLTAPPSHYHSFSSHHQYYKHQLPIQPQYYPSYTPPQPDYLTTFIPHPELRRTTSHKDYKRSGSRRNKYYPATFSHAPLELRPIKMKKSFRKAAKTEQFKMYTWSPYSNSLFYSEPPQGIDHTVKSPEEMRF
eukprot:TRINITY_DN52699_c0_g1_i1.p1 TRINITY_DN52699_c0_g1~~TRINITY_DN52699_c0_g1_i1.p1  ORF type:complete len:916 (+),score=207.05 TRINITY_DN52699_c0_g1_i1:231-2750(+)